MRMLFAAVKNKGASNVFKAILRLEGVPIDPDAWGIEGEYLMYSAEGGIGSISALLEDKLDNWRLGDVVFIPPALANMVGLPPCIMETRNIAEYNRSQKMTDPNLICIKLTNNLGSVYELDFPNTAGVYNGDFLAYCLGYDPNFLPFLEEVFSGGTGTIEIEFEWE